MIQLEKQNQQEVLETSKLTDSKDVWLKEGLESLNDEIQKYMENIPSNIGEYFTQEDGRSYCRINPSTDAEEYINRLQNSPEWFEKKDWHYWNRLIHFNEKQIKDPEINIYNKKIKENQQRLINIWNYFEKNPTEFRNTSWYTEAINSPIKNKLNSLIDIPNNIGIEWTSERKNNPFWYFETFNTNIYISSVEKLDFIITFDHTWKINSCWALWIRYTDSDLNQIYSEWLSLPYGYPYKIKFDKELNKYSLLKKE